MGAWIETLPVSICERFIKVASYMGAWIETINVRNAIGLVPSHPTWVRGLKLLSKVENQTVVGSHPTWVRGLKPLLIMRSMRLWNVASYMGAWIETHGLPY